MLLSLMWGSACKQTSPVNDRSLGPMLPLGHEAPMNKRGIAAGDSSPILRTAHFVFQTE